MVVTDPGGPGELSRFARGFSASQTNENQYSATAILFAIRWRLGTIFGWDDPSNGVSKRVPSLRDRLPPNLLNGNRGPDFADGPFRSVYLAEDEWVSELANKTVHALMHVGWISDGQGGFHAQLTALVKPNSKLGLLYMAAIKPFRLAVVYPQMLRTIDRNWPLYRSTSRCAEPLRLGANGDRSLASARPGGPPRRSRGFCRILRGSRT
ncbi:DUF2867 domain-containing protein [Williamsia muralis]|uniref:DUF2867 domain-containing protein n=1 Tax=Williamsia marianensis TaxID=85044 RepID=UPI003F5CE491